MALYEITSDEFSLVPQSTFEQLGLSERGDIQKLLRKQIEVVLPDTLIIAEEYSEWEDSRRRIDLLGIDKSANLVVIELKRTESGGYMELQALRYAAMVDKMTFDHAVSIFASYLAINGGSGQNAEEILLEFLGWIEPDEDSFAQDIRIVLISADFSKELTTSVLWLNGRSLDIRCIRLVPYRDGDRVFAVVEQVIPLPEATEYQVKIREKEQKERVERSRRYPGHFNFWKSLLELEDARNELHRHLKPSYRDNLYIKNIKGMTFLYVLNQYDCRVEIYVDRGESGLNKRTFDDLFGHKAEIETAFDMPLSWERLDSRKTCRIAYRISGGGYKSPESQWKAIQKQMIEAMIKLDRAFLPYLSTL